MPIYKDEYFKDYVNSLPAATENDLAAGNNTPLVRAGDVKKLDVELLGRGAKVVAEEEYSYAIVDADGKFLFGIKKTGEVEWALGIPDVLKKSIEGKVDEEVGKSLIDAVFANGISFESNDEYSLAIVDSEKKFLFGIKKNGEVDWGAGVPGPIASEYITKVKGKSLIDAATADSASSNINPEFVKILLDSDGKIIESVNKDGCHLFFAPVHLVGGVEWTSRNLTDLELALKENGFSGGQGDWSSEKSLQIAEPRCAIINFTNISSMPISKTSNLHGVMQFWDGHGNYFKKNVLMNAQGNSSMQFVKKNIAIDICNDEWIGDDTFKLRIGDWVAQDSFHLKAFYTDYFRGVGEVGYNLYKRMVASRGLFRDRTWKKALVNESAQSSYSSLGVGVSTKDNLRLDTGAYCFPMGFPCQVFLNGEFYGLFAFQLKKHRDNYHMDKSEKRHIHLDGTLNNATFFGATNIDWTAFEIRNPKKLVCMDGTDYDGDNPKELIDSTSIFYDASNKNHVNSAYVKGCVINLSQRCVEIESEVTVEAKKEKFERYFDKENVIDYQIFGDVTHNSDGFGKNWQWTTWDGEKWFVNHYDLDMLFGAAASGRFVYKPINYHFDYNHNVPTKYAISLYGNELTSRYNDVRKEGVVSPEFFINELNVWCSRFGISLYEKEYKKWEDSPCNNNMVVNTDYWELVVDADGNPVIADNQNYSNTASYNVGDTCTCNYLGATGIGWYYTFKCVSACTGQVPADFMFKDSIWRVKKWLDENFNNMDALYGYSSN